MLNAADHTPLATPTSPLAGPLVDRFGRVHSDLRLSVTDQCNLRCQYCMPAENVRFLPREELLTFDELERFVRVVAGLGVRKLRVTGGEPLVRHNLPDLIARLTRVPGIEELALTTNGMLLVEQAQALKDAGLQRLNVSLDALSIDVFRRISRRDGLDRVLAGIAAADRAGFREIKLNCVAMRGANESEIVPLARYAREFGFELRFIEYMPLDAEQTWTVDDVLTGDELRSTIEREVGPLEPIVDDDPHRPAKTFRFVDGRGRIGFINSVTQPFCGDCNRLRLTAEGRIRNCLFSIEEWDARRILRDGGDDLQLVELIRSCVGAKQAGHGINTDEFLRPARAMFQIGG